MVKNELSNKPLLRRLARAGRLFVMILDGPQHPYSSSFRALATEVVDVKKQLKDQGKQLEDQGKQLEDQSKQLENQGKQLEDQGKLLAAILAALRPKGSGEAHAGEKRKKSERDSERR